MTVTLTPGSRLWGGMQPGGLFSVRDVAETPGEVFYVGSNVTGASDSAGYGRSPATPFATLDYAVGNCTADRGDVIYCLPKHAEVVSAAAGLDLDVAGITVVGLGRGSAQPTITLDTATTADVDIDAADITVVNMHFRANFADIVAAIDVNADDFTLDSCRMTAVSAGMNAKIWVQDAAATGSDRITIKNCRCIDLDAANTHFVNFAGTGDGHMIVGNVLHGDFGAIAIGGAGVVTNCLIADNVIYNAATTNDSCINIANTSTGIVVRNLCGGGAAVANGVTATTCTEAENYYQLTTSDLSGVLDPPNA